jgi:hypothetical protein
MGVYVATVDQHQSTELAPTPHTNLAHNPQYKHHTSRKPLSFTPARHSILPTQRSLSRLLSYFIPSTNRDVGYSPFPLTFAPAPHTNLSASPTNLSASRTPYQPLRLPLVLQRLRFRACTRFGV